MNKIDALRMLAELCENGVITYTGARDIFIDHLCSYSASIRYTAVSSLWQISTYKDPDLIYALLSVLTYEHSEVVKKEIEYLLKILKDEQI